MNYGLYLSAAGVLTNMYRQDILANNLANTHTVGFKPDVANIQPRPPEAVEDDLGFEQRHDLLDRLGGGVLAGPQSINFALGRLDRTERPLDIALAQADAFLAVSTGDRDGTGAAVALTRDGRLVIGDDGFLVTASGGHRVLGPDDTPIRLEPVPTRIDRSGGIWQKDAEVARLQVATVADPTTLRKQGENLFNADDPANPRRPVAQPRVLAGHVEASGTDPIRALVQMINTTRAVSGNANFIRYHDRLLDRAVNVLGRVVA